MHKFISLKKFSPLLLALLLHIIVFTFVTHKPESIVIITDQNMQATALIKLDNFNRKISTTKARNNSTPLPSSAGNLAPTSSVGSGDTNPESTSLNTIESSFEYFENPIYPKIAREHSIEGHVQVEIYFNENGNVENIKILESTHSKVLEEATLISIRKWKLKTSMKRSIIKKFEFKLN